MIEDMRPSGIQGRAIEDAIGDLSREAQVTITGLIGHIRKVSLQLAEDKKYIEFLYGTIYLPNKEYFDGLIEDFELGFLDDYEILMELVGGIIEVFVYRQYNFHSLRFSQNDDDFYRIKRNIDCNIDYWIALGWIERNPAQKIPKPLFSVYERIRQRICFLSIFSNHGPSEAIGGHRITELGRKVSDQFMKLHGMR